ncbi:MAG: alkaline phosphatase family protein [Candidatus Bipolaricaulaceae bacterium]
MNRLELLIVAWDGADYALVSRWLEAGLLPNLRQVLAGRSLVPLRSTLPPITATAWASFHLGVNPGKHAIFDFATYRPGAPMRLVSSRDLPGPTFWELVSRQAPVGFLGFPLGYPARRLGGGFWVPGFLAPRGAASWPPDAMNVVHRAAPGYAFNPPAWRPGGAWAGELVGLVEAKTKAALALAEAYRPALLGIHYQATDAVQHFLWGQEAVEQVFAAADRSLGRLVDRLSPKALLLVSDHGMGPLRWDLHLNSWLLDNGFLALRRRFSTKLRHLLYRRGLVLRRFQRVGERMSALLAEVGIKPDVGAFWYRSLSGTGAFLSLEDVDWPRTVAFSPGGMGAVSLSGNGAARRALEAALGELRSPDGDPVVAELYRADEVYWGDRVAASPHLLFLTRGMEVLPVSHRLFLNNDSFSPPSVPAHHRMRGILAAAGRPPLGSHRETFIWDVAPAVLDQFGLAVPGHMEAAPRPGRRGTDVP